MWGVGNDDDGNVRLLVVILVGWLGKGEHVFEDRRSQGEDELVDAEVVR